MIRSLNEPRGETFTRGSGSGASICGTTGTSILGGGGGGGGGGLNCEPPGGSNWADAPAPIASANTIAQTRVGKRWTDKRFMEIMS